MQRKAEIKKVFTKVELNDKKTDSAYWRKQSYSARLAALEEIRQGYHRWRYAAQPGFQIVYRIIKR